MSQKFNVAKLFFKLMLKLERIEQCRKKPMAQKNIFFKLMLKLVKNGTMLQSLLLIKVN
jgi:hypothetical protein